MPVMPVMEGIPGTLRVSSLKKPAYHLKHDVKNDVKNHSCCQKLDFNFCSFFFMFPCTLLSTKILKINYE